MLQLMESQCISILTYAMEVIHVANRDQRRRLRVAYNSVYRRIFGYRSWESVTDLQHALCRKITNLGHQMLGYIEREQGSMSMGETVQYSNQLIN